jgi:hypothetical protein
VITAHDIIAHVGDFEHLSELFSVTGEHVQEGETIEVLLSLVAHFNDLVITLTKSFAAKLAPDIPGLAFRSILLLQGEGTLHGCLDVTTSKGKSKSGLRIANKVESNFWEAFGLEIGNNGTTTETAMTDEVHNLTILEMVKKEMI